MLSDTQKQIYKTTKQIYRINSGKDIDSLSLPKFIPNLRKKERYIVQYDNLQLYLSLGMQLEKDHRVSKFR